MSSKRKCQRTGKTVLRDEAEAKRALAGIATRARENGQTDPFPTRYYQCQYCGRFHLTSRETSAPEYQPGRHRPTEPTTLTPDEHSEQDRLLLEGIVRRCVETNCETCMHDPDWGLYRIRRGLLAPLKSNTQPTNEGDAP